ncbi:hypothetical protein V5O48_004113 [Marasmius crinis-equi]|uniref:Extracellular serine-rich protein n=1 Tax=Marasmius crinis-equi TaxID=585013 RepID=A0ABR3FR16_9AGAR
MSSPSDDQTIIVGQSSSNLASTFTPSSITAKIGETIQFQFRSGNHTVTQSTFSDPCTTKAKGLDTGFNQAVAVGASELPVLSFVVNTTDPLWFYCAQVIPISHCRAGMVFAINPTADQPFEAFRDRAIGNATTTQSGGASRTSDTSQSSTEGMTLTSSTLPSSTGSPTDAPSSSSNKVGIIVGVAIGSLAFVALAFALGFFLIRRRRRHRPYSVDLLSEGYARGSFHGSRPSSQHLANTLPTPFPLPSVDEKAGVRHETHELDSDILHGGGTGSSSLSAEGPPQIRRHADSGWRPANNVVDLPPEYEEAR